MSLNIYLRTCYLEDMRRLRSRRIRAVFLCVTVPILWIMIYCAICVILYYLLHPEVSLFHYPLHLPEILACPQELL